MKYLIFILIPFSCIGQSVTNQSSGVIYYKNITPYAIINLKNGDTLAWYPNKAEVLDLISSHSGSGSVTSIIAGRGLTGGTITSTGTLGLDTVKSYTWTGVNTYTYSAGTVFKNNDLRETDARGILVTNKTPATDAHPIQLSPAISMEGTGWDSFDGVSETQSIELYLQPDGENERPLIHADILIDGNRTTDIFSIGKTGQFTTTNGYKVQNGNIFNSDGLSLITGAAISYTNGASGDRTSGTDTLSSGTKTVTTTAILTGDIVVMVGLSASTPCATCGVLSLGTITSGTSFVVNSSLATDSRLFRWFMVHHQ